MFALVSTVFVLQNCVNQALHAVLPLTIIIEFLQILSGHNTRNTKITKPWNGPEFVNYDQTAFLLLTRPNFSMLLSVVSSRSQLNWRDQVRRISLNHSMAMNRYEAW